MPFPDSLPLADSLSFPGFRIALVSASNLDFFFLIVGGWDDGPASAEGVSRELGLAAGEEVKRVTIFGGDCAAECWESTAV